MKIGIFGGSFNPIHNMHLKIANYLISNGYVDKVIFVPTGNKYSYKTNMISAKKRLKMIKLATRNNKNILVSDYEIKNTMVYTYQTLLHFKNKYKQDTIYFICGMDNLNYIDTWKNSDIILDFSIIVVNRNNEKIKGKFLNKKNIEYVKIDLEGISSTIIRKNIKLNKSIEDLVPKNVLDYINKNNLYREDNEVCIKKLLEN